MYVVKKFILGIWLGNDGNIAFLLRVKLCIPVDCILVGR